MIPAELGSVNKQKLRLGKAGGITVYRQASSASLTPVLTKETFPDKQNRPGGKLGSSKAYEIIRWMRMHSVDCNISVDRIPSPRSPKTSVSPVNREIRSPTNEDPVGDRAFPSLNAHARRKWEPLFCLEKAIDREI